VSTATLAAPTTATTYTLTAADRCDGCGAQAYITVDMGFTNKDGQPGISQLLFCIHHFDKHEAKLTASPNRLAIKDERERLFETEKARTKE
jgi:hypothetical protein